MARNGRCMRTTRPILTHLWHRRQIFAVMHNAALWEASSSTAILHETARIHRIPRQRGHRMAARRARSSPNECDGSVSSTTNGRSNMKAARIHRFGAPDVVIVEEVPRPAPAAGELLIRVAASGVGPWDALIREGKSKVSPPPPLTLGSDLSGVVEEAGPSVSEFKKGDEIYGVTNPQFCGANAQYAVAHANMVALRPTRLSHVEAASAPVIAVTAWQMLFEYGNAKPDQTVMILGAAGNVGAYAVQLAVNAGLEVISVVGSKDIEYVKALGSQTVANYQAGKFENAVQTVDLVLDTVGGKTRERSYSVLKSGGSLVSVVSTDPMPERPDARSVFFYAEVTTERLNGISKLFSSGQLTPQVGSLLPLNDVRTAHEMLAGAPHKRGKIVLEVNG
jgi:NADPH:quinone reductase-like Zn-dependent oxidoreductase